MKKIFFISSKETIPNYFTYPLVINKKKLKDIGFEIQIIKSLKNIETLKIDTLCIQSKPIINLLKEKDWIFQTSGPVISFLKFIKKKVNKIIWLDDSDSTSITHFEVIPYVDLYLKKQIFKNKNLYKTDFYGGRIFSDYYNKRFDIFDKHILKKQYKLHDEFFDKLDVSWNIGLGDTQSAFLYSRYIKKFMPKFIKPNYNFNYITNLIDRPLDVFLRTSVNLSRESIAFHRKKMVTDLQTIIKVNNLSGIVNNLFNISTLVSKKKIHKISKNISNSEYRYLLTKTKIMPSPFGWGEVGARDFEAFINGCLVIKPNMNYMKTWPNFFIQDETYVSCNLDFSDLRDKMIFYLNNNEKRLHIVNKAQNLLKEIYSENGMKIFCNKFKIVIGDI